MLLCGPSYSESIGCFLEHFKVSDAFLDTSKCNMCVLLILTTARIHLHTHASDWLHTVMQLSATGGYYPLYCTHSVQHRCLHSLSPPLRLFCMFIDVSRVAFCCQSDITSFAVHNETLQQETVIVFQAQRTSSPRVYMAVASVFLLT